MEKFWMIVNVKERYEARPGATLVPDKSRPNVLHLDEDAAKRELIRLQTALPTSEFVLMEAMAVAVPQPVVTYTIQSLKYPVPF